MTKKNATAPEPCLNAGDALEAERRIIRERWEKFERTGEALSHDEVVEWVATLPHGPGKGQPEGKA